MFTATDSSLPHAVQLSSPSHWNCLIMSLSKLTCIWKSVAIAKQAKCLSCCILCAFNRSDFEAKEGRWETTNQHFYVDLPAEKRMVKPEYYSTAVNRTHHIHAAMAREAALDSLSAGLQEGPCGRAGARGMFHYLLHWQAAVIPPNRSLCCCSTAKLIVYQLIIRLLLCHQIDHASRQWLEVTLTETQRHNSSQPNPPAPLQSYHTTRRIGLGTDSSVWLLKSQP